MSHRLSWLHPVSEKQRSSPSCVPAVSWAPTHNFQKVMYVVREGGEEVMGMEAIQKRAKRGRRRRKVSHKLSTSFPFPHFALAYTYVYYFRMAWMWCGGEFPPSFKLGWRGRESLIFRGSGMRGGRKCQCGLSVKILVPVHHTRLPRLSFSRITDRPPGQKKTPRFRWYGRRKLPKIFLGWWAKPENDRPVR